MGSIRGVSLNIDLGVGIRHICLFPTRCGRIAPIILLCRGELWPSLGEVSVSMKRPLLAVGEEQLCFDNAMNVPGRWSLGCKIDYITIINR